MKSTLNILFFSALILLQNAAQAQQPTGGTKDLGNEDITIVKDYTPVLNDAFKINIIPSGDTSSMQPPVLTYQIDPKPVNSNYNITPIKPVRIKDDNIKKLYRGWIKAGYGLENMPLLDFSFNSLRSKNFDAGIHFNHLSSTGAIKDYGPPANSSNELGLSGTRYFDKFSLGGKFNYDRDVVHYYGFKSPPDLFSKAETKHSMDDLSGSIKIQSLGFKKDQWQYAAGLGFYTFNDNRSFSENNVNLNAELSNTTNIGRLFVKASIDAGNFKNDHADYNRNIVRLNPRLTIAKDLYSLELGANLAIEGNDGESDFRLYPHVKGTYQVINDAFKVFAEITGDLKRNDMRTLSEVNPFYGEFAFPANTNQKIILDGGAIVKLDHDLMFTASASLSKLKDQPYFFGYKDSIRPLEFSIFYDDVTQFSVKGEWEYKMAEKVRIAVNAEFNSYNTKELDHPFYSPAFRLGLNGEYTIAEKIYLKANLFYNGEVYSYTQDASIINIQESPIVYEKVKGYFDANIGVDYRFSKVLSFFANLNNIGFSQYFRYVNYPSYRFTGMIGGSYSF